MMKDNSQSILSTKKEAISNVIMNFMKSLIMAQGECWQHV